MLFIEICFALGVLLVLSFIVNPYLRDWLTQQRRKRYYRRQVKHWQMKEYEEEKEYH